MPSFYYSNPAVGVGISNLAEALIGDPERDARMGLLGDQRRTEQVQRRKLEAEALAQEIRNREQQAAFDDLQSTIAALTGTLPESERGAAGAGLSFALRAGAGSNAQQFANAINLLRAMGLAGGDDTQQRQALIMRGRQPTADFAGTLERANELISTDAQNATQRALAVAREQNRGAMERAQLGADAAMDRVRVMEEGRDRRARAKLEHGSGTPLTVRGTDLDAIRDLIDDLAFAAAGGDQDVELEPSTEVKLIREIAEAFQQNRNLPLAAQEAWAEIIGQNPEIVETGRFIPFVGRTILRPQAIREAREALRAGVPRDAVIERLRSVGIEPPDDL